MNDLWKTALSLSFSGTLLMAALLAVKRLRNVHLGKTWQYYLWLVVVLRLLLPVTLPVNLTGAVFAPLEKIREQSSEIYAAKREERRQPAEKRELQFQTAAQADQPAASDQDDSGQPEIGVDENGRMKAGMLVSLLWLSVGAVLFAGKLFSWRRFTGAVRAEGRRPENPAVFAALKEQQELLGIRKKTEVLIHSGVSSPMLYGLIHPCIVLPEEGISTERLGYIFRHELIHRKKGDILYKWLVQLCLCLHWFNPFLRKMEKEIDSLCELSCDEAVMKGLDAKQRRAYGDTLLEMMFSGTAYRTNAVMLLEGKEQLKERLGAIMDYRKPNWKKRIQGAIAAVLAGAFALSFGVYASPGAQAFADTAPEIESAPAKTADMPAEIPTEEKDKDWKTKFTAYRQDAYYEYPYILQIGWNIPVQRAEEFSYHRTIQPAEGKSVLFYFGEETKGYMQEESLINALTLLIPRLQAEAERLGPALESPFVADVQNVEGKTPRELMEESYEESDNVIFSAVFPVLPKEEQESWLDRAYEDGKTSFFAIALKGLDAGKIREFCQRAWKDEKTNFFAITLDWMGESEVEELARLAYRQEKTGMFAVIADELSEDSRNRLLKQAKEERWGNFYLSCLESDF